MSDELAQAYEAWLDGQSGDQESNDRLADALSDEVKSLARQRHPSGRPPLNVRRTTTLSDCECDRGRHQTQPCQMPAAEHGIVITSPALCLGCLWVCWDE